MRIALFSDTYPPEINGVATATETLKKAFEAHGHIVYIVTTNPYSKKMSYRNRILRIPGVLLKKLYNYRLAGFFHPKATKIIRSWNLDVIHTQTEAGIGMYGRMLAPKLDVALVMTYHTMLVDYTYYVTHGIFDQSAKSIVKSFTKFISYACTEFTTPSVKTKDALRSYGVDRYINVIPNGIDLSSFHPDNIPQEKIDDFKEKHGLKDTFVILSLGRVAEEKSIDVILKSYAYFLKKGEKKKTKLLIVGDGPAKESLEKMSYDLGIANKVEFLGKVSHEEVPFYYVLSDLYVSASITETQGLTFIESIAAKTLVLCRFDDNLVDVIKEGVTGFYFNDEESFYNKLNMILSLDDKKNEIIEKSFIENQKYSIDKFYEKMLEVYNRALRKRW
jgi:1,2-diacylglycerol 3-alpha-glucosyltransferase